jgi:hypothetical protein
MSTVSPAGKKGKVFPIDKQALRQNNCFLTLPMRNKTIALTSAPRDGLSASLKLDFHRGEIVMGSLDPKLVSKVANGCPTVSQPRGGALSSWVGFAGGFA